MHHDDLSLPNGSDAALISLDGRPNALIIGDRRDTTRILDGIVRDARTPVHRTQVPGALVLPDSASGTLLVDDVGRLNPEQQMKLLAWLDESRGVQVVSTTERRLYDLVETGAFLDALYYRLNVITLDLANGPAS